jgi:hypothetical protein
MDCMIARPRNIGEVQFTGEDIRKQVTTELQAFALIVTAEPYFAVTQPSDVVVIENSIRADTRGTVETVEARYELLPRGSYLMNRPSEFTSKPLEPGMPTDLAEARRRLNSRASPVQAVMRPTRSQKQRVCWRKRTSLARRRDPKTKSSRPLVSRRRPPRTPV